MYGLLLENLATFIKAQWGEGKWESVRRNAGIDLVAFSIHHVYPETLMRRIARSAFQVLGVDERQFFKAMGVYFVQYVSQYGYDQLLSVLGRHLRDFLNGLDNLHEYLKFSYPKMRAPSFYCDDETESGLKLHYRSKRRGFVYYVMGQIKQVAKQFYNQECTIHLITEEVVGETIHVVFELAFDNSAFSEAEELRSLIGKDLRLPVRASTLFELFPFCIVFNSEMEITHTGHTLMTILKDLVGQVMTEAFDMTRPLIPFCFSAIMQRRNNIFELVTVAPIHDVNQFFGAVDSIDEEKEAEGTRLRLRGQMLYMEDWNMMLYLANPVMPDLNSLVDCSLFINDLSLHDCSRDLVLAGTQQSVELKLALDQEQQKSRKLVQSMKKLDEEMKRTDELLYQMIPKQVADRIRKGENPVETCQTFDSVSILFTDVVNFTNICSQITPLQVVSMLNHMYFLFDQLSERNGVYKVETVGDSYMVVSGAPVGNTNHSERICDMAMDIIDASEAIDDPSGRDNGLRVRVGCHSGAVVAGVVGIKMPRYCLFGDTVNTASRMESTAEPGKIQISEACKTLLPTMYSTELRGTINIKGKGEMYTYWLLGREARVPLSKYYSKTIIWTAPTAKLLDGIGGRPLSPNSTHKHSSIDRTDSLSLNSPSSSGVTTTPTSSFATYKSPNQRFPANYKNPALQLKPRLQYKFAKSPPANAGGIGSSSSATSDVTTTASPKEPLRTNSHPSQISNLSASTRSQSSPEIQRPSHVDNRNQLADEILGHVATTPSHNYPVKALLQTSKVAPSISAALFQEKIKQNRIQTTTVYDQCLIKEAFESPLERVKQKSESGTRSSGSDLHAQSMGTPHHHQNTNKEKHAAPNVTRAVPTGVGEGLLKEFIFAVETSHDEKGKLKQASPVQVVTSRTTTTTTKSGAMTSLKVDSDSVTPERRHSHQSAKSTKEYDENFQSKSRKAGRKSCNDLRENLDVDQLSESDKFGSDELLSLRTSSLDQNADSSGVSNSSSPSGPSQYEPTVITNIPTRFPFKPSSLGDNTTSPAKKDDEDGNDSCCSGNGDHCQFAKEAVLINDCPVVVEKKFPKKDFERLPFQVIDMSKKCGSQGDVKKDQQRQAKQILCNVDKKKEANVLRPMEKQRIIRTPEVNTIITTYAESDEGCGTDAEDKEGKGQSKSPAPPAFKRTMVLIGNKRAEVKVEKWIRQEFAEAKETSVEDSTTDDELGEIGTFPTSCDSKWLTSDFAFDDGVDEKWIDDDIDDIETAVEMVDIKEKANKKGSAISHGAPEIAHSSTSLALVSQPQAKWMLEISAVPSTTTTHQEADKTGKAPSSAGKQQRKVRLQSTNSASVGEPRVSHPVPDVTVGKTRRFQTITSVLAGSKGKGTSGKSGGSFGPLPKASSSKELSSIEDPYPILKPLKGVFVKDDEMSKTPVGGRTLIDEEEVKRRSKSVASGLDELAQAAEVYNEGDFDLSVPIPKDKKSKRGGGGGGSKKSKEHQKVTVKEKILKLLK